MPRGIGHRDGSMRFNALLLLYFFSSLGIVEARDWPTWRGNARRSGYTAEVLPTKLKLHWTTAHPKQLPAWPEQAKLTFDLGYEPVVAGNSLFYGSTVDNSLTARYLDSGQQRACLRVPLFGAVIPRGLEAVAVLQRQEMVTTPLTLPPSLSFPPESGVCI